MGVIFSCVAAGIVIHAVVHVHIIKLLEFPLQGLKGGPVRGRVLPALHHDVIDAIGTVYRTRHPVTCTQPLHQLVISES